MPKARNAVHLISTRVAPEDADVLDFVARHEQRTPSAIVREAVRKHLHERLIAITVGGSRNAA